MANEQERKTLQTLDGVDLVAGVWILISPWLLGFSGEIGMMWSNFVTGLAISVFSIIGLSTINHEFSWPNWINTIAGVWLLLSPFILLAVTPLGIWNNVILGAVVVVLSAWAAMSSHRGHTVHRQKHA